RAGPVRVEERRQRRHGGQCSERLRGFAFASAELPQCFGRCRAALEAHGGDGDVQRRLLVGGEVEGRQVVLVGRDAVPLLGAEAVDRLEADRDADPPQRVLVALELASVRELVVGIPGDELHDLLERERAARVEERGDQVGEPLEPVGHSRARSPASTPAAPAARNNAGSAAAGLPIDTTSSPALSRRPRTSGGVTSTRSWRAAMPAWTRSARSRSSSSPPSRGTATATRSRHASRNAVREWCDSPTCRDRGSANDTRRHAIGCPSRAAAASRIPPTSIPENPSLVFVPTMPGPIATIAASASATWRAT